MKLFSLLITFILLDMPFAGEEFERIIIPVGDGKHEVSWDVWDEERQRYGLRGFEVDETGCIYLQDSWRNKKIKVFNNKGTFLRDFSDQECDNLFLWDTVFCGHRSRDKKEEIVVFSIRNGGVVTSISLPELEVGRWTGYRMIGGRVYFSSFIPGRGKRIAYDIASKKIDYNVTSEWGNRTEQQICSTYVEASIQVVGKIFEYTVLWMLKLDKVKGHSYVLRIIDTRNQNLLGEYVFKLDDIGYELPGLEARIGAKQFLYIIGHPDVKRNKNQIWITRINLKLLAPELWRAMP